MARSVGARPKKAVKERVAALRGRLGQLDSSKWQAAQVIFDEMCALCGVQGPSGGNMAPRACRFCDRYGHTRQHCEHYQRYKAVADAREIARLQKEHIPVTEADCSPEDWEVICEERRLLVRYEELMAEGRGCKARVVRSAADLARRCECTGCVDWRLKF